MSTALAPRKNRPVRRAFPWHIVVLIAPAFLVYTVFMVYPIFGSLLMSLYAPNPQNVQELLVRPALGTVTVFNIIPIWNDLWFPLVLTNSERVKTITYGAQAFMGQFANDYNAILASLTLSMVPVILLYILFSRQLVRGLTSGAVK